jgi:predicted transcriptional regulator
LGRPRLGSEVEAAIQARRKAGMGMQRIARELGIGVSVVQRVLGG